LGRDGEHGALIGWCSMRLVILFLVAGTEGQGGRLTQGWWATGGEAEAFVGEYAAPSSLNIEP